MSVSVVQILIYPMAIDCSVHAHQLTDTWLESLEGDPSLSSCTDVRVGLDRDPPPIFVSPTAFEERQTAASAGDCNSPAADVVSNSP